MLATVMIFRLIIFICIITFTISSHAVSPRYIGHSPSVCRNNIRTEKQAPYIPVIVELEDENDLHVLEEKGAVVYYHRGNLALCSMPAEETRKIQSGERIKGIKGIELRIPNIPAMDIARTHFGADRIYTGEGLPSPYRGKGVVVGMCDIGFDASHPTFLTSDRSESRIARVIRYNEWEGTRTVLEGLDSYVASPADNIEEAHATHVAGIMAGAYSGNDYRGMAPEATIVATTSQLSDVGILAGAEDIIAYAKSIGAPAVVNMSVGSYTGPHDGSSLFCQYLDMLGDEAIICISSGNEGSHTNTLTHTFTEQSREVAVRLANRKWTQFEMYGMVDCWSNNSRQFNVRLGIYDEEIQKLVVEYPVPDLSSDSYTLYDSTSDVLFAEYYTGIVGIGAELNRYNGRYNCSMEYDAVTEAVSSAGPWAKYNLAMIVSGDPGTTVTLYADGQYTFLKSIPGNPAPNPEQSVSDICTGFNVISVGMYNSRQEYPSITEGSITSSFPEGFVNQHSGYGSLIDGRILPMTVAPGGTIISAFSRPCYDNGFPISELAAMDNYNGTDVFWVMNSGTSMSAPYVAGSIATWLEANSELTIRDIHKIISATNRTPLKDPQDPRNGEGWFDPYEGIKEAIRITGVDYNTVRTSIKVLFSKSNLLIENPCQSELRYSIYTADAVKIVESVSSSSQINIPSAELPAGVLILQLTGENGETNTMKFCK